MLRAIIFSIVVALTDLAQFQPARAAEPEIYYFGANGCDFCANGLTFLKRLQNDDARIRLHDYDISGNPDDAIIYVRVVTAIGLSNPQVPLTIIGHHVIIGYEDDESTGNEIRLTVEQCRVKSCPDILHGLVTIGSDVAAMEPSASWTVHRRFAKSAQGQ